MLSYIFGKRDKYDLQKITNQQYHQTPSDFIIQHQQHYKNRPDRNNGLNNTRMVTTVRPLTNGHQIDEKLERKIPPTIQENSKTSSSSSSDLSSSASIGKRRSGIVPLSTNYDDENVSSTMVIPKYAKSPKEKELITSALRSNEFLQKILHGNVLEEVIDAMFQRNVNTDEVIISEGEKGSHLYVSASGKFETTISNKGVVSQFEDARVFGELAILYSARRMATIRALTQGSIWVLDGTVFQYLLVQSTIREQDETLNFLQNVPVLNTVGVDVLRTVANLLKAEFHPTGTMIVRQGEPGDKFYIIRAGTVTIRTESDGVVGQFKRGQFFGELALLREDRRQATVIADSPGVECLTLTRQQFIDHFGDVEELPRTIHKPKHSLKNLNSEFDDVELHNLNVIATLGVGGFGRVELVQNDEKSLTLIFALKCVKKVDMVEQHQKEHVFNEKTIQMFCKSDFIVRLYRTYKDTKYLYFLMEACLGGDLWTLLQKQPARKFDEKSAKFLAACVLEAFAYLHRHEFIYRDLKPENLLIDRDGYVKLTDFGFAKRLGPRGKAFTFAGTPEYISPEIILNRGHDKAVDYWAFGVFVFELLTGRTPFRSADSNHMRTYKRILAGIDTVDFPAYIPPKARHLVQRLCRPLPPDRLGCQRNGIEDIRTHKWFNGFNWTALHKRELSAPFKPHLNSETDTQYFDEFEKDPNIPPDEISGWDKNF